MRDFYNNKIKKLFKTESGRLNGLFAILIVLIVAIVFLLNAVTRSASEHLPLSADLTANGNFDLGEDSKEVLSLLDDNINIYALASKNSYDGNSYLIQVRKILEQYPKFSKHVNLEFVDFAADPTFTTQYPNLDLSEGDVLVVGPESTKQIQLASMFNYTYDTNQNLNITGSRAEEAISSAIVSVITEDPVNVSVLTGNAVSEDRNTLEAILVDNNFVVNELDMVTGDFSESEILVLLAPQQDLSEDVLKKIDSFLYNNGEYGRTLIYSADVNQPELPNLEVFLREWGIQIDKGAVFETDENNVYGYQPYYPFTKYTDDTFVTLLRDQSKKVLVPLARPITKLFDFKDNKTVTQLLDFTSTTGVRPENAGENFTTDDSIRRGPMPAMLFSTLTVGSDVKPSQVLVSPSTAMFSSTMLGNTSIANSEYLIAILNTITQREDAVSIEAKSLAGNTLTISSKAASAWGVVLCIVVPVLILAAGILIYLKRRYR